MLDRCRDCLSLNNIEIDLNFGHMVEVRNEFACIVAFARQVSRAIGPAPESQWPDATWELLRGLLMVSRRASYECVCVSEFTCRLKGQQEPGY